MNSAGTTLGQADAFGVGLIVLARAWRSRVLPLGAGTPPTSYLLNVAPYDASAADVAAARLLTLVDDGDHAGPFIAALSGRLNEAGGPIAEALATFAAAVDAALPLDADAFETAVYSAFRVLMQKLRAVPRSVPPEAKS